MNDSADFMRALDGAYQHASGLRERRFYSIFYSKIEPNAILIIGYNPGGDPETWDESALASRSYYEHDEHEYVDRHYPLAVAMRSFLLKVLDTSDAERIRGIPKTNLIFRRSTNQDTLKMSKPASLQEAKPSVEQIIARCQPRLIIFEGTTTLDAFENSFCTTVERFTDGDAIMTPNGRSPAAIYRSDMAFVRCLERHIPLVGLGHPSKFAGRHEWNVVIDRARRAVQKAIFA